MADPNEEQLSKLRLVLAVAEKNGNQLFIDNIKRDIEALERGEESPIIAEYLTDEERGRTAAGQSLDAALTESWASQQEAMGQ